MINFSIIVPSFNHEKFLEKRIESILQQSYQQFEIIILDDGSTDNSKAIIEKYRTNPKVSHIIYNTNNSGFQSKQWEKGISLASNDWIWIAESDDFCSPEFLETAATAIQKAEQPVLFYCDSWKILEDRDSDIQINYKDIKNNFFQTNHWHSDYIENGATEINNWFKYGCMINNVSAAVFPKKNAAQVLESFEHLGFYSDWLFFMKMMENCNVIYSSQMLNYYRSHSNSHFNKKPNNLVTTKKETFYILNYILKKSIITEKNKLIKFFTEQYLSFGLVKELKYLPSVFKSYMKINSRVFFIFLKYFFLLKISRKKIKYLF